MWKKDNDNQVFLFQDTGTCVGCGKEQPMGRRMSCPYHEAGPVSKVMFLHGSQMKMKCWIIRELHPIHLVTSKSR